MHSPHSPTVRQLPPIKRLLAGALVAGAVAAVVPPAANATESKCFFDPPFGRLTMTDRSGPNNPMRIHRVGDAIAIQDGPNLNDLRVCASGTTSATVNNVNTILVNTPGDNDGIGGISVNMEQGPLGPGRTLETDGNSEIEIQVRMTTSDIRSSSLEIFGTPQNDTIRVGEASSVNIGPDADTDIRIVKLADLSPERATRISVNGRGGNDVISGRGTTATNAAVPSESRLLFTGGFGADRLLDGLGREDSLFGGPDNDLLNTADTNNGDLVSGNDGTDIATVDQRDIFITDTETVNGGGIPRVGKLALAPAVVKAKPGKVARMTMSWTHPQAWKLLRAIEWRLSDGGDRVGTVTVKPRSGRVVAAGIKLVRGTVSHKGKTATAKLAVRVPKALAGRKLRVDVQATDSTGRTQLARRAGLIRVGR